MCNSVATSEEMNESRNPILQGKKAETYCHWRWSKDSMRSLNQKFHHAEGLDADCQSKNGRPLMPDYYRCLQKPSYRSCRFHGITFFEENHEDWIKRISSHLRSNSTSCVRIHTINPEILAHGLRSPQYLSVLRSGDWNVIDGLWLSLTIFVRKRIFLQRRCGSDLVYDLFAECEKIGRPFFILGGTPDRLAEACVNIRKHCPSLVCDGFSPAFSKDANIPEQAEIAAKLQALRPAIVAVCLGAPKQEQWMWQNKQLLEDCGVKIAAGLGGTVDFLSGRIPRAPIWVRRIGMEWLYRAKQEPFRFKRYWKALPALLAKDVDSQ